ncbi:hypothetical protein L9F63_017963, partial [Diploptera punctata]
ILEPTVAGHTSKKTTSEESEWGRLKGSDFLTNLIYKYKATSYTALLDRCYASTANSLLDITKMKRMVKAVYVLNVRQLPGESVSPRSWEEIDTSMSTLPITLALLPMLDDEMITVIKSVLPCSLGYRIHKPHVKISNFIILTDELQIRGYT